MQMKMFLTRLGPSSKCVITGDLTQVDLPYKVTSGLRQSMGILKDIEGIAQIYLTAEDVVRHRLVKDIIRAYDRDDERRQQMRDALKNGYISDKPTENEGENAEKEAE